MALDGIGSMRAVAINTLAQELSAESSAWDKERKRKLDEIREHEEFLNVRRGIDVSAVLTQGWKVNNVRGLDAETMINASITNRYDMPYTMFSYDRVDINTARYI